MSSVSQILNFLPSFVKGGTNTLDDDGIDRWNHHVTTSLFVMLSIFVTTLQHLGSPMSCVIPDELKTYDKYAHGMCWISDTYTLDSNVHVPRDTPNDKLINYYQWVPLFLLIQAMLFYAPCALWEMLYPKCGVDLDSILSTAARIKVHDDASKKSLDFIVREVDKYLDHYRRAQVRFCKDPVRYLKSLGKKQGNFLVVFYMMVKVLYLVNASLQFWILGHFLSIDFLGYGWEVMTSWFKNSVYPTSLVFPRNTLCDFPIRVLGSVNRRTVQCVLPINFYNEKVYLLVWFWLVFTIVLNALSLIAWLFRLFGCSEKRFIKHYMKINRNTHEDFRNKRYKAFIGYLRRDGVFILRLLKINVNGLIVSEVVEKLLALSKETHPEYYSKDRNEAHPGNGFLLHTSRDESRTEV